jgi:hypothetical protein
MIQTSSALADPEPSIIRATLRALLEPRRLLPIVLVSASLVAAQGSLSHDSLAIPIGVAMCALTLGVAPVSWRVLFPERIDLRHGGIRLILYGAIGVGVVLSVGVVVPKVLNMGRTLLTSSPGLVVSLALFLVGGGGLARDIRLESRLLRAEARAAALAREAERTQLLALRAHLDPHFLFNTLNAIAEWCREDGETAERAVLQLSAMLRAVLAGVRAPAWSLGEELALVDTLFSLHRLRDPERLEVARNVPDPLPEVRLPPLLLLPLAENAVKHGPAAGHAGTIALDVRRGADGRLVIALENPGRYSGRREGGTGLDTVERRLALAYDGRASLRIGPRGDGTLVEVTLPVGGPMAGSPT